MRPIFSLEGMEVDQCNQCSPKKLERCYNDFNRSQLGRQWSGCTILDRVWHKSPSLHFCPAPLGNRRVHAEILQLKRLRLTWISVSVTMASCFALLPTESRWHHSDTSTCINALLRYPSGSHSIITWCCSRVNFLCFTNCKRESIVLYSHFIVCLLNCTWQMCHVHQL